MELNKKISKNYEIRIVLLPSEIAILKSSETLEENEFGYQYIQKVI